MVTRIVVRGTTSSATTDTTIDDVTDLIVTGVTTTTTTAGEALIITATQVAVDVIIITNNKATSGCQAHPAETIVKISSHQETTASASAAAIIAQLPHRADRLRLRAEGRLHL